MNDNAKQNIRITLFSLVTSITNTSYMNLIWRSFQIRELREIISLRNITPIRYVQYAILNLPNSYLRCTYVICTSI